MAENEKYLQSIQGHIDVLKSKWEEFSVALADSGQLKALIDGFSTIATILTKMTNTIGGIGMIATPLMAMASKTSNMGLFKTYDRAVYDANGKFTGDSEQAVGLFTTANRRQAELDRERAIYGRGGVANVAAINSAKTALQEYNAAVQESGGNLLTVEEAEKRVNEAREKGAGYAEAEKQLNQVKERDSKLNTALTASYGQLDDAGKQHVERLRAIAEESRLAGESQEQLSKRLGDANAAYLNAEDMKPKKEGKLAGIAKSTGAMFGNIAATMAISAIIEGAMTGFDYLNKKNRWTDNAKVSAMKDSVNEYNNAISDSKEATKTIEGLSSEFKVLSKGVDESGHNVSLTATEFARYKDIVKELTSISPSLVQGYNAEGDAIINRNTAIEEALKLQQDYADLATQTYLSDDTFEKIYEGAQVRMQKAANAVRESLVDGIDRTLAETTSERGLRQLEVSQEQATPTIDTKLVSEALERDVNLQMASAADLRQIVKERERILSYAHDQLAADGKITKEEQKQYEQLQAHLNEAATKVGTFDSEMQPVVDWLQQSMAEVNKATGESAMAQIPEAMRDSYVEGLRQIVAEGGSYEDMKDKAADLGNVITSELGPGSEYEKIMEKAQEKKDEFLEGDRTKGEAKKTTEDLKAQSDALRDLANDYYAAAEAENDQAKAAIGAMLTQEAINLDNFATDNILSLAEAFNPLSDAITEARTAKEKFDKSMEGGDYDTGIKAYKEIYDSVMDDYNNAGYGTQAFWTAAEQTLGRETLRDLDYDIDKVNKRMESMKTLIDENSDGTKAFDDLLLDHRKAINALGGESHIAKNGAWYIDSDEIHAVATELGMADDLLVSLIDNARHWQKVDLQDTGEVRKAINDMEGTKKVGDTTYQWLDKVEDAAMQAGINFGEMQDRIDEMDDVKLLDFDKFRGDSKDVKEITKDLWQMNSALKKNGKMDAVGFIGQMKGMGRTVDETTMALEKMQDEGLLDLSNVDLSEYGGKLSGLVNKLYGEVDADNPFMGMEQSIYSMRDAINDLVATLGGVPEDWLHIDSQLAEIDAVIAKGSELDKQDYKSENKKLKKMRKQQQKAYDNATTESERKRINQNIEEIEERGKELTEQAYRNGVIGDKAFKKNYTGWGGRSEGVKNLTDINAQAEAYQHLTDEYNAASEAGAKFNETLHGNVELGKGERQALEWTNESLEQNKNAILSWEKDYDKLLKDPHAMSERWAQIKDDLMGQHSTVEGGSGEFGEQEIPITYSTFFEDGNGNLVKLNADKLDGYLSDVVAEAQTRLDNGEGDNLFDNILAVDKEGLDGWTQGGQKIHGIIAGLGDDAVALAEQMHYMGDDGAVASAFASVEETVGSAGQAVEDYITKMAGSEEEALKMIDAYHQYQQMMIDAGRNEGYDQDSLNQAVEENKLEQATTGVGKWTDALKAAKKAGDSFGSGGLLDQEFDKMYRAADKAEMSMYDYIDSLNLNERQTRRLKKAVDQYITATGKSTKGTKENTRAEKDNTSAKKKGKRKTEEPETTPTTTSPAGYDFTEGLPDSPETIGVKVNVDKSEVDETEGEIDKMDGKDVDVEIKAKTKGLNKALKQVDGLTEDSREQVIMASIEYQKTGDLSGLQEALDGIADKDVKVKVAADVADALGGIESVDGQLTTLDGQNATPTIMANNLASGIISSVRGALNGIDGMNATATISASVAAGFWSTIGSIKSALASLHLAGGTPGRRIPALSTGTPDRRRVAGSAAKGGGGRLGPHGKGGLTLTGELGPELVWLPDEDRSFITGIRGPEMQDLPANAVVWPYEETKRIFGGTVPPGFLTNKYAWSQEELKSVLAGSTARGANFGSMAYSDPGSFRSNKKKKVVNNGGGGGGGNGGGGNGGGNGGGGGHSRSSSSKKKGKYTPWSEFIEYQDWMLDMEYYDEEEYEKAIKRRYKKYRKKIRKWRRQRRITAKEAKKEIREAKKDLHDATISTYEAYIDKLDHLLKMGDITEAEYLAKVKAKGAKLYSKGGRGNKPKRGYAKEFREWQEQVQDAADEAYEAFVDSIDHNLEMGYVSVEYTEEGATETQEAAEKAYDTALKKLKKAKSKLKKAKKKLKKKKNKKNREAVQSARQDVTDAQRDADKAWYDLQMANQNVDKTSGTSSQAYNAVDYYNDLLDWYNEGGTVRTEAGKKVDEATDAKSAADARLEAARKKRKRAKKKYKKSGKAKDRKKWKQAKRNFKDAQAGVAEAQNHLNYINELTDGLALDASVEHLNLADMSDEQIKEFYEDLKDARQEAYDYLSDISERTLANSMPGDWESLSNYIAETTKNLEMLDESLGDADKIIEARQDIVDSIFDNLNDKLDDTLDLIKLFGMSHAQSWDSVMKVIDQGIDFWNKNYKQISTNTDAVKQYYDWLKQAIDALQEFYSDLEGQMSDVTDLVERMIRQEMDDMIDALDKQRDKYDEIIEKKKESLQLTEDELDYQDELADYAKREAKLRTQIAALSKDDSRAAQSRRAELESELDELLTEKNRTVRQETLSRTQDSLDKQSEQYGQQITQITDYMQALLDNQSIINKAVYENIGNLETNDLLKRLVDYNDVHGDAMMSTIQEWAADLNDVIVGTADQHGIDVATFTDNVNKQLDTVMQEHANASIAGNQDASMTEAGLITNAMRNASNQIAGILNLNPGQVADAFGLWLGSGQVNNVSSAIFTMQTTLGNGIKQASEFLAATVVGHSNLINPKLNELLQYIQQIAAYKYVPGEAYNGASYGPRTVESVTRDLNQAQQAQDILQNGLYNANGESYETLIAQKEAELKQKEAELKQAEKTYQNKQTAFENAKAAYQNKKTDSNKNKRDKAREARNNAEAARNAAQAARDAVDKELQDLISARDTALEAARSQNSILDEAMNTHSDLFEKEQNQAGYQNNVDVAQARMDNKLMPKWNDAKAALEEAKDAFKKAKEKKEAHPNSKKVAKAYEKAKAAKQAAQDAFDKIDAKKTKLQAEIDSGTANITAIDEVINSFNIDDLLQELEELKAELQDIDLDPDIDSHHGGLATGFAGNGANLKQHEVLSVLTDDELVLNKDDQMKLGMQLQMLSDIKSSLNKSSTANAGMFGGGAVALTINAPVTIHGNATQDTINELNKFGDHIADVTLSRLQNAMRLNGVRTSASFGSRKFS